MNKTAIGLSAIVAVTMAGLGPAASATPAALGSAAQAPALTYTPSPDWWGANGRVNDIRVVGDKVYLAGGFDYIGKSTGYGVSVDATSGRLTATGLPKVDGVVRAAVSDGAGGWYIGGDFQRVKTRVRPGLAHLLANGEVDAAWSPRVGGGTVNAMVLTPTGLVVGGTFTSVNELTATRLAKVSATTGETVTGWRGSANATVRALAGANGMVYVGGEFTNLSGNSRSRLGRLSESTGLLDSTFQGVTSGTVQALAVDTASALVYAGGDFATAAGGGSYTTRQRLAAFGTDTGALTGFTAHANAAVQALVVPSVGQLVAGGLFTSIGGAPRGYLAQVSSSGSVGALDAAFSGCNKPHGTKYAHGLVPCTPEVSALAVAGDTLLVGGRFGRSGPAERHDAAAFSLASGAVTGWNPVTGDRPLAIGTGGRDGTVFLGGEFTSVNGLVRKGFAALDATTGAGLAGFTADADEYVETMVPSTDGSRLYIAGKFTAVQGQSRPSIASIITATGQVDPTFKPRFNRAILTLAYANGSVFAGGKFTKVSGVTRLRAAKVDGATGAVDLGWVANTNGPSGALRGNGMVMGLEVTPDGSTAFLGGPFTSVNGTVVSGGIAVVSGATGALGPNQLSGVQGCAGIGPWINQLYLSDDGQRLYGGDVCPDFIYQWDAANLSTSAKPTGLNWKNLCNGGMQGKLEVNGHFYYGTHGGDKGSGGYCQAYPGGPNVAQQRYFVFDDMGVLQPDAPEFDTPMGIWSFAATGSGLLIGGDFTFVGSRANVQQGLAMVPGTP